LLEDFLKMTHNIEICAGFIKIRYLNKVVVKRSKILINIFIALFFIYLLCMCILYMSE